MTAWLSNRWNWRRRREVRAEAVVLAASLVPHRVDPLIDAMRAFTDEDLLGFPGGDQTRLFAAVASRNDLMDVITEIAGAHPKPGAIRDR